MTRKPSRRPGRATPARKKVAPAVRQLRAAPIVSAVPREVPTLAHVPEFDEVAQLVEKARAQATRAVNVQLIDLYWKIGAIISRRIESNGWGKGTVEELAAYLARTQPGARGFSPQNLWRMRQFHDAYRGMKNSRRC